jgi:DNA-directed RNA polymerase subunit RPC12/RpoP
LLTYKCKSCSFGFSQADKAWDRAVAYGACPECGEKLEGFHVSEKDAEHVRKNLEDIDLLNAEKSLAESLPSKGWLYILCLFCFLFVLFAGGKFSDTGGTGGGKIVAGSIVGLALIINFYWKRHKRRSATVKNRQI